MLNSITFKNTTWIMLIQEKARKLLTTIHDFKEKHKSFLINCAVVYMSLKIGLVLLATFSAMTLLISHITQYLAIELSKTEALIFASSLTLIIMLKLYFIFRMLITYDRSGLMIKSAINAILFNGRQGVQRLEETFQAGVLSPLLGKVKNR